jgi:tetratricopeptide (TPR) repeat protein
VALEESDYEFAEQLLKKSQQLRSQMEDHLGVAATQYRLALLAYYHQGDYTYDELLRTQVLFIQESKNDKLGAILTLRLLANIALANKEHIIAETYCCQALNLCYELQNQPELAATLYSSSVVYRRLGRLEQAQTYAAESILLLERMGDRKFQALALYESSVIKEALQEYQTALTVGLQSLQLLKECQDKFNLVYVLSHLGDLYKHSGQIEKTRECWLEALKIAIEQSHPLTSHLQENLRSL